VDFIGDILVWCGDAARWLGDALGAVAVGAWRAFDYVANPVLAPVLSFLNRVCTVVGDGVYAVLGPLPAWAQLLILSALAGIGMMLVFGRTSNQAGIAAAKDKIKANLLALKLYKDQIHVTLRAQVRLAGAIAKLQWHMLFPVLVLMGPTLLVLGQMGVRYQWRPLAPGEQTLIRLIPRVGAAPPATIVLQPNTGLRIEAGPVAGDEDLVWRVRADQPGRHELRFDIGGAEITKELVVGQPGERVSAKRPGHRWTSMVLHPVERPLPGDSPAASIEIEYPGTESIVSGSGYWLITFLVVSMLAAVVTGRRRGIRF
jgi:hypothetical protein